jgi:hypothetical protein
MIDPLELKGKAETAVLIGLITDDQDAEQVKEYLDELEFLATTADIHLEALHPEAAQAGRPHLRGQRQAGRGEGVDGGERCGLHHLR